MLRLPKGMNEYSGKNVYKMQELLENSEVPMSVSGIMKSRLKQGIEFHDLWAYGNNTSDLVVYPKENYKEVYVFLTTNNQGQITKNGRKALDLIKFDNLASNNGAVVEQLKDLGRKGLIKVPRNKITHGNYLPKDRILDEQVWRILARHPDEVPAEFAEDKELLKEYSKEVEFRTENSKNMALYIGNSLKNQTTLKMWYISGLLYGSNAGSMHDLNSGDGCLLGIAPDALGKGALNRDKGVNVYPQNKIERALEELGFPGLTKTLMDKLGEEK